MIEQVETEMRAAAEKLDFEKAAELRNLLEDLKRTTKPMTRFTRKALPSIDPQEDLRALADALQLGRPPRIMEVSTSPTFPAPISLPAWSALKMGSGSRKLPALPHSRNTQPGRIRQHGRGGPTALLAGPSRGAPGERCGQNARLGRDRLLAGVQPGITFADPPASAMREDQPSTLPDLIIVDGGKGQLSSACKELQRLGLYEQPVIGLAKEFEEIYRPGRPLPLQTARGQRGSQAAATDS